LRHDRAVKLCLQPHPTTPCPAVQRLHVALACTPTQWQLRYTLEGAPHALRLPPPSPRPSPTDGLWRHTCFEAFVAAEGSPRYREFNFSPSGDWAAYAFSAPRQRDPSAPPAASPRIHCTLDAPQRLCVDVLLPAAGLPTADLILGLSAVIEAADGTLSYWALAHPRAQPDFHDRSGWTAHVTAAADLD